MRGYSLTWFSFTNRTYTFIAKFKVFLNGLTDNSIDRAIACFQEGLQSHKDLPCDFDSLRAQISCHRILQMTEKGSTAMGMVYDIPKFWINLNGLIQSSNLNTMESTITRVFCMQGSLKFHYWLLAIVPAAIRRTLNPTHEPKIWIDKLVADVRLSILKGSPATFSSSDYLPNLIFPQEYRMTLKRYSYDDVELPETLTSILSSILRCWLHFPRDEDSLAQLTLLEIVSSICPMSILFLDKIWEMYKTPFSMVFDNNWDIRRSKNKLTTALANFKKEFALHPFAIPGSSSYNKLQNLSQLIHQWMRNIGVDSNATEIVS